MNIKFDLIIANPPYGNAGGANITKKIIDNVYFEEYVNLLPANDYKRNDSKDLFKYAREMESISNGFNDAVVTTHLCKIAKEPNNITLDEFEISNYIDRSLDKYFTENRSRSHYAIDNSDTGYHPESWTVNKTFIIGQRVIASGRLPLGIDNDMYRWNIEKSINNKKLLDNHMPQCYKKMGVTRVTFSAINFNTEIEKDNFVEFIYSRDGFRFISKIFTAVNIDSGTYPLDKVFPKVDWTRSWTVEEILKDYGYTDLEIENIMADLDNFKGMDD